MATKLLINEPPLQVLPTLAKKIGLNEAILLQQVHYWIINPKIGVVVDGKRWVRNTVAEWQEDNFPFWSVNTIRRAISSAIDQGILLARDDLNKINYDNTKWYSINYDALEEEQEKPLPKMGNPSTQNGQSDVPNLGNAIPETTQRPHTEIQFSALSGRKNFTPAPKPGSRALQQEEGDYERVEPGHENDDPWDSTKAIDAIEHLVLSLCYAQNISKTNRRKLHDPVNVLRKGVFVKEPSPAEEMERYPEEFAEYVKKQAVFLKNNGGLSVAKLCKMVTKYETATYGWLAVRPTNYDAHDPNAPWN